MNPLTQEPLLDADGNQILDENGISQTRTREMTDVEYGSYVKTKILPPPLTLTQKVEATMGMSIIDLKAAMGIT